MNGEYWLIELKYKFRSHSKLRRKEFPKKCNMISIKYRIQLMISIQRTSKYFIYLY